MELGCEAWNGLSYLQTPHRSWPERRQRFRQRKGVWRCVHRARHHPAGRENRGSRRDLPDASSRAGEGLPIFRSGEVEDKSYPGCVAACSNSFQRRVQLGVSTVQSEDWAGAWKRRYRVERAGSRIVVVRRGSIIIRVQTRSSSGSIPARPSAPASMRQPALACRLLRSSCSPAAAFWTWGPVPAYWPSPRPSWGQGS